MLRYGVQIYKYIPGINVIARVIAVLKCYCVIPLLRIVLKIVYEDVRVIGGG